MDAGELAVERRLLAACLALAALHAVAALTSPLAGCVVAGRPQGWGWGIEHLREVPLALAAALGLLFLAAFHPTPAGAVRRLFARLPAPAPVIAGLLALPPFLLLRDHVLSGDWFNEVERVETGVFHGSNPLTDLVFRGVWLAFGAFLPDGFAAIRLVSALSGALFVALLADLARALAPAGPRRAVLFWVPMLAGTLLLFFGHVEVYGLPAAGLLAYFRALLARAQLGRRPWLPPLLLGTCVALHATAVLLLPTLFFAASRRRWLRDLALFAAVPVATWGFLFLHQYGGRPDPGLLGSFLGSAGQSLFLPWFREPPALYGLLDRCHWLDVANTALLVGGAALPLLLAGGRAIAPRGFRLALGWSALAWLGLALVDNVSYPKSEDWDLFALGAVPLTLFAALRFDGGPRAAAVVIALALLHAAPWVGARLFPDRARRFEEHRLLARAYFARQRTAPATLHHLELRRLGVRDPEVLNTLGALLLASGRSAEAETVLLEVTAGWPETFAAWKNLGLLWFDRKDYERSRRALDRAVYLERDDAEAQLYRGKAHYACRDWATAAEALERSLRLQGDDVSGWVVLAQANLGLGRFEDAERAGREGLARAPRHELLLRMMADLAGRRGDEAARARHLAVLEEVQSPKLKVEGPERRGAER